MSLAKVLSNSRHVLLRKALPLKTAGETVRQVHVKTVPARDPMPTSQQAGLALMLFFAMWATPVWILYHIPDYQGEDRNTYTGK